MGVLAASAGFYTDWLWFEDVGYANVFWKGITTQATLAAIVAAAVFLFVFVNLLLVRRNLLARSLVSETPDLHHFRGSELYLNFLEGILQSRFITWLQVGIAALVAIVCANGFGSYWFDWEMYLHRTSFDLADPIFGRDVSFYLFQLPFLSHALRLYSSCYWAYCFL